MSFLEAVQKGLAIHIIVISNEERTERSELIEDKSMDELELTNFQQVEKLLNHRFLLVPRRNDGMIGFLDSSISHASARILSCA